jgi:hypothetical protein
MRRVHEQQASAQDLVRLAEHDIDAALQLAADATGFGLWGQLLSQSGDELEQEILLQMGPVTDEQIAKSMEDYRKEVQCTNVAVLVCAACNVKVLEDDGKLSELHELDRFQLSDKQQQTYNNYDSDLRKHFNVYIHHDAGRNVYYGLNPDLVVVVSDNDKGDGKEDGKVCSTLHSLPRCNWQREASKVLYCEWI